MKRYYEYELPKYHGHGIGTHEQSDDVYLAANTADTGGKPLVVDISKLVFKNDTFRTALWTGSNLQLTVMSIEPGEDVGLEIHHHTDQFFCVEKGIGLVQMGDRKDNLYITQSVYDGMAIFVPAGTWHNLINTGTLPLKLYTIYAPPNHPFGTVHKTKAIAEASEH